MIIPQTFHVFHMRFNPVCANDYLTHTFCIFKLTIICSKDRIDTRELRFMVELSGNMHGKIGDLRIERGLKKTDE